MLGLSSFASTFSESTTLADYVGRMKDGQEQIFYATGESRQLLEHSLIWKPSRPRAMKCCCSPIPSTRCGSGRCRSSTASHFSRWPRGSRPQVRGRRGQAEHGDFAELLTWLQKTLDEHVKEVRLSTRLTSSPACLITDSFGITPQLARMYRASGQEVPVGKRILELNPDHALVVGLRDALASSPDGLSDTAELLYGTALLAEGGSLDDPAHFAAILADRLAKTF